jgi:nicotinate dehydrogenase subunit B
MPELRSRNRLEESLTRRFDLSSPGIVLLKTGKVELGQGILLALRQIAAEELDLAIDAVVTVSGDTSASPFEGGTVGSMSVETSGREVRDAAAELRSVLFDAAARKLAVSVSEIAAEDGKIFVAGRQSKETFWSLAAEIRFDRPLGPSAAPKSPKLYKTVGTNIPQTHLLERFGGGAFIHDLSFDGMLHGRVLRKPHPDARLESVDADSISGPGVRVVHERDFIGVVAESEQALAISMARLERRCRWSGIPDGGPQTPLDILANARVTERVLRPDQGSSDPDPAEDGQTLSAVYSKPLIGHGSIGPSCGIAIVSDSGVEIWSQSQNVFALRDQIARVLGRQPQDVIVRHRLGAGCYGHNGADDAAMDAAMLAHAVPGRPVRVQWTRQDELRCEPLGSPMRISIWACVREGRIAQWRLTTRSGTHIQRPGWGGQVNLLGPAAGVRCGRSDGPARSQRWFEECGRAVRLSATCDIRIRPRLALPAFGPSVARHFRKRLRHRELHGRTGRACRMRSGRIPAETSRRPSGAPGGESCRGNLGLLQAVRRRLRAGAWLCAVQEHRKLLRGRGVRFGGGDRRGAQAVGSGGRGSRDQPGRRRLTDRGRHAAGRKLGFEGSRSDHGTRLVAESWKDYPILSFAETPETNVEIIAGPEFPSTGVGEVSLGPTAGATANAVANVLGLRVRDLPLTRERLMKAALEAE